MTQRPEDPDGPLDVDARFADIVARFDEGVGERRGDAHGVESSGADTPPDLPRRPGAAAGSTAAPAPEPTPDTPPEPTPEPAADTRDHARDAAQGRAQDAESARDHEVFDAERVARINREVEAAVHGADGGHYVPPEPEPFPTTTPLNRLAWAAVLGGPLLLLLFATLWQSAPQWLVGAIVVAVVVGFGRLVWLLPRSGEERYDDGAQV